jgi:hypothetical protein
MVAEYHLIDLTCGVSHGGFRSLEISTPVRPRGTPDRVGYLPWERARGIPDPRADQLPVATGPHSFALALRSCDGPISSTLPPLLASLLAALGSCSSPIAVSGRR